MTAAVNDVIDLGLLMLAREEGIAESEAVARAQRLTTAHAAVTVGRIRERLAELRAAGCLDRVCGSAGARLRETETGRGYALTLLSRQGGRTCALLPVTAGLRLALA